MAVRTAEARAVSGLLSTHFRGGFESCLRERDFRAASGMRATLATSCLFDDALRDKRAPELNRAAPRLRPPLRSNTLNFPSRIEFFSPDPRPVASRPMAPALPDELLGHVLSFCGTPVLAAAQQVCSAWRAAVVPHEERMYGADLAREAPLVLLMRTAAAGTVKEALRDVRLRSARGTSRSCARPTRDGFQRPPNLPWTAEWYEVIARVPTEFLVKLSLANGNEVVVRRTQSPPFPWVVRLSFRQSSHPRPGYKMI